MVKQSLLCLFILATWPLAAQDLSTIQKLKQTLNAQKGEEKFNALCQLAWAYRVAHPDSGIYYARQAYDLGQAINVKGIAEPLNLMGLSNYHKGNILNAYENFTAALSIAKEKNDSVQVAHSNNNIGRLFMEQGMMPRSLDHLQTAMRIFTSIYDSSGCAFAHQNLGNYYRSLNKSSESESSYKRALNLRLGLGATSAPEAVSTLLQLGRLYMANNNYEKALAQFVKADSIGGWIDDTLLKADVREQMAECYLQIQQLDKAEVMALDGLSKIIKTGNARLLPKTYLTLGKLEQQRANMTKAREYYSKSLAVSNSGNDLNTRLEAYYLLWQTASPTRPQEGFKDYTNYMNLKDSIRSMEARQRESQLQFQLEIERKDAENNILKAKEERKSFIIAAQVVLLIVGVTFVVSLIRNKRKILKANRKLDEKNHEVENVNTLLANKTITLENHMTAIMDFSKNKNIALGNMEQAARDIVSITARKLNINQVSIWLYNDKEACIETLAVYNLHQNTFVPNMKLRFQDAPQYFNTIKRERILVSDEARSNPSTREFTEHYFKPNNIYSLLDATFSLDGHLTGLLCCEQQETVRYWTTEDKLFVSSIADIISLALRSAQRLEYEKRIKEQNRKIAGMNEVLEERVKQRTVELEDQNRKLSEYAFINSHLLRGPVSRILGLINLIKLEPVVQELELMDHLTKSGTELDHIVKKITMALNDGVPLTIEELKKQSGDHEA